MDRIQRLNMLFDAFAEELNISRTMFDNAERAYNALGEYIKSNNEDWDVKVIPQGSFALGTVVKPVIDGGQYDVDLVVLVKTPTMNAGTLRYRIYEMLENHGRYEGKIENKKPCIRIQYADSSQFHMDVASAQPIVSSPALLNLAKFDGSYSYSYEPSNPFGYIDWFKSVMNYERVRDERIKFYASTEVKEIELPYVRTSLQKAVQIIKRHRDVYCDGHDEQYTPSSIILTTLCGLTYNSQMTYAIGTGNVYEALSNMLRGFQNHIQRDASGNYNLPNPSYNAENFLLKWNEDDNYASEFTKWISQAINDILIFPEKYIETDQAQLRNHFDTTFGKALSFDSLSRYAREFGKIAERRDFRYDSTTQDITTNAGGQPYKPHTYFGDPKN